MHDKKDPLSIRKIRRSKMFRRKKQPGGKKGQAGKGGPRLDSRTRGEAKVNKQRSKQKLKQASSKRRKEQQKRSRCHHIVA